MNKFCVLFIAVIIAACTPSIQNTATSTITPAPTATFAPTATETLTSTLMPVIEVDGVKVPDPRASNPELFDLLDANTSIVQFVRAMSMIGAEANEQQILDAMNAQAIIRLKQEQMESHMFSLHIRCLSREALILTR